MKLLAVLFFAALCFACSSADSQDTSANTDEQSVIIIIPNEDEEAIVKELENLLDEAMKSLKVQLDSVNTKTGMTVSAKYRVGVSPTPEKVIVEIVFHEFKGKVVGIEVLANALGAQAVMKREGDKVPTVLKCVGTKCTNYGEPRQKLIPMFAKAEEILQKYKQKSPTSEQDFIEFYDKQTDLIDEDWLFPLVPEQDLKSLPQYDADQISA